MQQDDLFATPPPTPVAARSADLVALDFETTGVVGDLPAEPWQLGMVRLRRGRVDPITCWDSLLHIGDRPFNPHAPGQHHKLRDQLAAAPTLRDLWGDLRSWWTATPLVAHNAGVERTLLEQTAPLHRFGPWLDTLRLTRQVYPRLASYSLDDLLKVLELTPRVETFCPDRAPHDALYDAVGCGVLLEHVLALPGWRDLTIPQLAALGG